MYTLIVDEDIGKFLDSHRDLRFGRTVLDLSREVSYSSINIFRSMLLDKIPGALGESGVISWLDEIGPLGYTKSFWRDATVEVSAMLESRAGDRMRLHNLEPDEKNTMLLRDMAVLNFAYASMKDLGSKQFIQKSIGMGFFARMRAAYQEDPD